MNLYMITRKGNAVQNEVHTMIVAARSIERARELALSWTGSKIGFEENKIDVKPITLDKEQIVLIQSL